MQSTAAATEQKHAFRRQNRLYRATISNSSILIFLVTSLSLYFRVKASKRPLFHRILLRSSTVMTDNKSIQNQQLLLRFEMNKLTHRVDHIFIRLIVKYCRLNRFGATLFEVFVFHRSIIVMNAMRRHVGGKPTKCARVWRQAPERSGGRTK